MECPHRSMGAQNIQNTEIYCGFFLNGFHSSIVSDLGVTSQIIMEAPNYQIIGRGGDQLCAPVTKFLMHMFSYSDIDTSELWWEKF